MVNNVFKIVNYGKKINLFIKLLVQNITNCFRLLEPENKNYCGPGTTSR